MFNSEEETVIESWWKSRFFAGRYRNAMFHRKVPSQLLRTNTDRILNSVFGRLKREIWEEPSSYFQALCPSQPHLISIAFA